MLLFFLHTIGHSSSCRLINNSFNIKTGNSTSIFCCLPLRIIEICRNCDDSSVNSLTEISLSCLFHFHQYKCSHLGWWIIFTFDLNPSITTWVPNNFVRHILCIALDWRLIESSSDQSLSSEDCVLRVSDCLSLSSSSYKSLTFVGEGNDRWCGSSTLCVFDNFRGASFHDSHTRVSCSKVYSNNNSSFLGRECRS